MNGTCDDESEYEYIYSNAINTTSADEEESKDWIEDLQRTIELPII